MDIKQFRQIIREEIKKAMQEELRDILTEAIEIASRPEQPKAAPRPVISVPTPSQKNLKEGEVQGLSSLLQQTAATMNQEDYHQVLGMDSAVSMQSDVLEEAVNSQPSEALPDFVARASEIFAASLEKDKLRSQNR